MAAVNVVRKNFVRTFMFWSVNLPTARTCNTTLKRNWKSVSSTQEYFSDWSNTTPLRFCSRCFLSSVPCRVNNSGNKTLCSPCPRVASCHPELVSCKTLGMSQNVYCIKLANVISDLALSHNLINNHMGVCQLWGEKKNTLHRSTECLWRNVIE
jgi:hypothetical protein